MKRASALVAAAFATACGGGEPAPALQALHSMPPGTDVFLATLEVGAAGLVVGTALNVTERAGYDNQPYFTPDGTGFWYTVQDDQSEQTDIYRYDIAEGRVERVTSTAPESEYSATAIPGSNAISVIRVEADSMQRLWRVDLDGGPDEVILPDLAPVGYHKWVGPETLVMFVLGQPATLRIGHPATGEVNTVAESIGRSIHNIPGSQHVSFVQRGEGDTSTVMRLDPASGTIEPIAELGPGGDYHAWGPDGSLLKGQGSLLQAWRPDTGLWETIADFSDLEIDLSRLAVSPTGTHIAMVGEASR